MRITRDEDFSNKAEKFVLKHGGKLILSVIGVITLFWTIVAVALVKYILS